MAPLMVAVLVLGAAACGDSDDDGGSRDRAAAVSADEPRDDGSHVVTLRQTRAGSDREQIVNTLRYMPLVLRAQRGRDFCAKLTRAGRKRLSKTLTDPGVRRSCAEVADQIARIGKRAGGQRRPVDVFSVKIDGDEAVIETAGGVAGRSAVSLRMVKEDGEWRLPTSAFTASSGG